MRARVFEIIIRNRNTKAVSIGLFVTQNMLCSHQTQYQTMTVFLIQRLHLGIVVIFTTELRIELAIKVFLLRSGETSSS